jgi:hypothetical protein
MARGPRARAIILGTAHSVDEFDTKPDTDGVVRKAATVTVLTEGGGFLDVYYGPDYAKSLPQQDSKVELVTEIDVWNKPSRDGQRRYAVLLCSFRADVAAV